MKEFCEPFLIAELKADFAGSLRLLLKHLILRYVEEEHIDVERVDGHQLELLITSYQDF